MPPALRRRFRSHRVLLLFVMLVVTVIGIVMLIRSFLSYEGMAHRDFGGTARIASIVELFERVEKRPATDFVAVTDDPKIFGFPETRAIPASAIPKELADGMWANLDHSGMAASANYWDVLAHYDEYHKLRAIEFYGSRYGAFVSRDASLKPKMWGQLQQFAGAPIYITVRISSGD